MLDICRNLVVYNVYSFSLTQFVWRFGCPLRDSRHQRFSSLRSRLLPESLVLRSVPSFSVWSLLFFFCSFVSSVFLCLDTVYCVICFWSLRWVSPLWSPGSHSVFPDHSWTRGHSDVPPRTVHLCPRHGVEDGTPLSPGGNGPRVKKFFSVYKCKTHF